MINACLEREVNLGGFHVLRRTNSMLLSRICFMVYLLFSRSCVGRMF